MKRAAILALLLAVTACRGFDTGLNPRPDVDKQQGPLTAPPAGVLRGLSGEPPGSAYTPTGAGAGPISLRCSPRPNGLGSDCQPR